MHYEMLWDCKYCGTKKLLGLTHRFCANCGAPQDAAARYFPSDEEKVAVENHQFVGSDLGCPACGNWTSRAAKHCPGCGGPLEQAKEAPRVEPAPAPASPVGIKKKSPVGVFLAVGGVLFVLGLIGLLALVHLWKRESSFEVAGHSWERAIDVERFGPVRESAWCDSVPAGARILSRSKEQRSTKKIESGEECRTVRKDMGDGTFQERRECKPKYREEPIYDERCDYEVNKWAKERQAKATGTSLAQAPGWPDPGITRPGSCVGCEREGKRSEAYVVRLRDLTTRKESSCEFPQPKWASFAVGSKWEGKVAVIGARLDCDSLAAR